MTSSDETDYSGAGDDADNETDADAEGDAEGEHLTAATEESECDAEGDVEIGDDEVDKLVDAATTSKPAPKEKWVNVNNNSIKAPVLPTPIATPAVEKADAEIATTESASQDEQEQTVVE